MQASRIAMVSAWIQSHRQLSSHFHQQYSGAKSGGQLLGILRESIELLSKNGKLMALITIVYLALSSIFFSIFSFTAKSLLRDMLVKESFFPISSPNSSDYSNHFASIKSDVGFLQLVYVVFIPAYFAISFISTISTILLSAASYSEMTLSIKNLLFRVLKSWTSPLVTGFYTMLLVMGYAFFIAMMASPLLMFYSGYSLLTAVILTAVLAYIIYLYLSVPWFLALVVSVVEEDCFGIQALGRAGGLVKGQRIKGFALDVVLNLAAMIVFQGFRIVRGHKWLVNPTAIAFLTLSLSCLLKMFQVVAFTVFYFHCKKKLGEEIELQDGSVDSLEYTKISATAPLVYNV